MRRLFLTILLLPLSACSTIEKNNCSYALKPETFKTVEVPIVIPAGQLPADEMWTRAEFGAITKTVVVIPEGTQTVRFAPVYETIDGERILIEPGRTEETVIPPVTKQVEERVIITPAQRPDPKPPMVKYETRRVTDTPAMTVVLTAKDKVFREFENEADFEVFQRNYQCSAR